MKNVNLVYDENNEVINIININKVDWSHISRFQKLSETFMEKHFKDLDKYYISRYQKLSESFMDKHFKDLDKSYISTHQKLSEPFI